MKFSQATLETCGLATGVVVVIDVLRAFTTAAYALGQGASEILLVSTVDEAMELKTRYPGSRLMGEVYGAFIEGFDYSNSPTELAPLDLSGVRLVHRSSAGTQGVVRSRRASALFAASFVVAEATARQVRALNPPEVTFVITGTGEGHSGDEDASCADYLQALLSNQQPDPAPYFDRVRRSPHGLSFGSSDHPELPGADLELAARLDVFDFAMPVRRREGLLVLEAER